MIPKALFGLALGVLVDHVDSRSVAALAGLSLAVTTLALGLLWNDGSGVGILFLAAFALGFLEGLRTIGSQTYLYEIVGSTRAMAGIAMSNLVGNIGKGVGALLVGGLLEQFGSGPSLFVLAQAHFVGALLLIFRKRQDVQVLIGDGLRQPSAEANAAAAISTGPHGLDVASRLRWASIWGAAAREIRATTGDQRVRLLAGVAVITETLAFSSIALLPVLSRDVFEVGASGLGVMNGARYAGAVCGLSALAWAARFVTLHRGLLLVALVMLFGIALVGLGSTDSFVLALLILFYAGVAAGSIDALIQTLLQVTVRRKGSAMGVWVLSVGFHPIGQIQVAIMIAITGAPFTLVFNGLIMTAGAAVLALLPTTRRLR
jgi:MFS family permease